MPAFISLQSDQLQAQISPFGASLARLWLAGHDTSLVLGLPTANDYANAPDYSGGIVGPIAGRVSGAQTHVNGTLYQMPANTPPDCLHSGPTGTSFLEWNVVMQTPDAVTLQIDLPDGACGLPGNRSLQAEYVVRAAELTVTLTSSTDQDTLMNPALHAYWSLDNGGDLATHRLSVATARMCETGPDMIPTGRVVDRTGQDHDFLNEKSPVAGAPLDGCFCLADAPHPDLVPAMALRSLNSGIKMDVATNQPGLVLYTGEHLTPYPAPARTPVSKPFSAIAIEAQVWPDAANNANFPQIVVTKGQRRQQIVRFSLQRT